MPIPKETDRLLFREWHAGDLDTYHAICSDPRVMKYVRDGQPWSVELTNEFINSQILSSEKLGYCLWALIHKDDCTLIGYCGFVPADDSGESGWRLAHDYWGKGLATEAARHVLEFGFSELGFKRVIATVQSANQAVRMAEKLGMQPDLVFERNGRRLIEYACRSPNIRSRAWTERS